MIKLEKYLKNFMLENVIFKLDDKVVKKGMVRVFNTKQFFIKFKLENDGGTKDYELPYPYKVDIVPNGVIFNYALSAFIPKTEESHWKMACLDDSNASKIHNKHLYILKLSA